MSITTETKKKLLLVDDEPTNLRVLKQVLQPDYRLYFAKNGLEALDVALNEHPDIILLDVMMPEISGFEVCKRLKAQVSTSNIPVIFVTALKEEVDETQGFAVGAVDYITKPITAAIVKARVKTHLSLVHAEELKQSHIELVQKLGRASDYKDNETGMHIIRMSHYSKILAIAYGFSQEYAEELLLAAPMHDIGKIGIPDKIILKPGKLTAEEFKIMQSHVEIGGKILGDCNSSLLQLAKSVALYHHEKWDGSGYPHGLAGDAIPIEARIAAVADVFDALTSKRPYKEAWPVDKTIEHMQEQSGKHFDPMLIELLMQQLPKFREVMQRWPQS